MRNVLFLSLIVVCNFLLLPNAAYGLADSIPPYPCDYYGIEESSDTLNIGSIITAKDPDGITIGQFTVTEDGKYGLLSCVGDNPSTVEDEGAVDGDIITFYIEGVRQQRQAQWKSANIISVDLGTPTDAGAFNLHLLGMPGYTNYNNDISYSGVAVADMILDYLVPTNTDTQTDLMSYSDQNGDLLTSGSELTRTLNNKSPSVYNYGTTSDLENYSSWGYINTFDPTDQDHCIKQICRWLAYEVPGASTGKENVPIAVCTSADTALNADSDYKHWMSVVGIRTNQDPFPALTEGHSFSAYYDAPTSLELYGVYINDPGEEGLGFHSYIAADVWKNKYFRPIGTGLPEAGKYVAIFEPPDPDALTVTITSPARNKSLQVTLKTPQNSVSIYIPKSLNRNTKQYLLSVFEGLKVSYDFASLLNDAYFGEALKDTYVNRCFKVDGKLNDDYTIIPFDKTIKRKTVTTAAMIVNNKTGQFQMAFADSDSSTMFNTMYLWDAYRTIRQYIGWCREYPVNYWLSNSTGNALFPDWSIVTMKYDQIRGPVIILSTKEYTVTPEKEVIEGAVSPQVDILYSRSYNYKKSYSLKYISFEITEPDDSTVSVDYTSPGARSYLYKYNNRYFLIVYGTGRIYCRLKAKTKESSGNIREGGVSYIYAR